MKVPVSLLVCLAAVLSSGPEPSGAGDADVAVARQRLVYITLSAGFHHQVVPLSAKVLEDIGQLNGFDITATDDVSVITSEGLKPYNDRSKEDWRAPHRRRFCVGLVQGLWQGQSILYSSRPRTCGLAGRAVPKADCWRSAVGDRPGQMTRRGSKLGYCTGGL
jgi:hypothetical protein